VGLRDLAYGAYERRLSAGLRARAPESIPRHVGVLMDGNRRWARGVGLDTRAGHSRGGDKVADLVAWCEQAGVEVVTVYLLSTDNLGRPAEELQPLLQIIDRVVRALAADGADWRVNHVGSLDLLPDDLAATLKEAQEATSTRSGLMVNVAVAYGGRREIADAVRSLLTDSARRGESLEDVAATLDIEHIAEHLYTRGQPDPDLLIRTSGEQRLSGFLLWQSANSEFYFCDALWPEFRHVDFLRALRSYAERHRRFGG